MGRMVENAMGSWVAIDVGILGKEHHIKYPGEVTQ